MGKYVNAKDAAPGKTYRNIADGSGAVVKAKESFIATDYLDTNGNRVFVGKGGRTVAARPQSVWVEEA